MLSGNRAEGNYLESDAAPVGRYVSLRKVRQHFFAFHGVSEQFKAGWTGRVLAHKVQNRDNGEERRVH